MKKAMFFTVLACLCLLCGCTVFSVNPAATKETTVFDPNLAGRWKSGDTIVDVTADAGSKGYELVFIDDDKTSAPLEGVLFELEGRKFVQLYPAKLEETLNGTDAKKLGPLYWGHFQPVYSFAWLADVNDTYIDAYFLDNKELGRLLGDTDIVFYMFDNNRLLLCEDGAGVAAILSKTAEDANDNPDLWNRLEFERVEEDISP